MSNEPRILLIRLREIGDVVFTTPSIAAVRRRFPGAHIVYVVEPHAAAVVSHNPHLDEVLVAPRQRGVRGFVSDLMLARRLRARRFDVAIDFHGGPRASLLAWLSGAPRRIGYQVIGRSWMYTDVIARPRELRRRHSVENQWDLLAALGIDPPGRLENPVEMPVDPEVAAAVAARLANAGVVQGDRLAVVHVSAGNPFRRWPLESFVEVTRALAADAERKVVISSGPSDRAAAARVVAAARAALPGAMASNVLSCGDFSLVELRALMDRAAVYVGGDSGPLHIAATTRVPIVGIYGPTLPQRSAPWRDPSIPAVAIDAGELPCRPCDQRVCAPGDFRCLTTIRPERVVEAALRCVGEGAAERRRSHE